LNDNEGEMIGGVPDDPSKPASQWIGRRKIPAYSQTRIGWLVWLLVGGLWVDASHCFERTILATTEWCEQGGGG
jgi:hypothetical protein